MESPLQVRKLNEIGIQKNRSALRYGIKGDKYFSHLTPLYFFTEHQVTMKYAGIKSPFEGRWFHLTSENSSQQTSFYFVLREIL